jgi:hypothetical protein
MQRKERGSVRRKVLTTGHADKLLSTEVSLARAPNEASEEQRAESEILERNGLPKSHPFIGERYRPAVLAFRRRRDGLAVDETSHSDEEQNLDAL